MTRRLPPLLAARAFEAFARAGSVKGAAAELSVSPTVVSRHIQKLEASIGAPLVKRVGRRLALTDRGASYCTELQRAFDLIGEATAELRRDAAGARSIHLRCTPALAARFLLLRLPELQAHLGVADITLQPTSARPEINLGEADAEIAYLESAPSRLPTELRAEAFCRPRIVPVASAIFKAQHPQVRSIRDLLALPLISEQSTQQWRAWFKACGVTETPWIAGPRLWHSSQSIEAVRLHQGVALVSELLLSPGPKEEAIVEMVRSSVRLGSYYFVARSQNWYQPRIRRLRAWIRKSFTEGLASPVAPRRTG
jgi:LysR family glycine cleavage system transcriptional activator